KFVLLLRPASWLALLVCLFPARLPYWRQRREECCNPPEALTSFERLLPPARAQGFGTSCGLDRLSQGSPCPRSSGGDSRLPARLTSFLVSPRRLCPEVAYVHHHVPRPHRRRY